MASLARLALVTLVACGSSSRDDSPERASSREGEPSAARAELAPPDPMPGPAAAWEGAPGGFEPVVLPAVGDRCEGPVLWVGPDSIVREPALEEARPPRSELRPGVAREVWAQMREDGALAVLRAMSGSYNGPGGEPLFRWHLEQTAELPVLVFDRRVSRERLLEALRGARGGVPIRIGGVDEHGGRRCAIALVEEPPDMRAQSENAIYAGRIDPDGTLRVRGPGSERAFDRIEARAPIAREPSLGLHVVRIDPGHASSASLLRGLATSRWSVRRYGWLALPPQAPHCLPLVSGCGCAEGCARGVALTAGGVSVQTSASSSPRQGRVERWCFDAATGRVAPAGPIEAGDCFDAYVLDAACGGECTPRAMPRCWLCDACDATCAGAPIQ